MRYTLTVEMDNAAFEDAPGEELARILIEAARDVRGWAFDRGELVKITRDINGNCVGTHGYQIEADLIPNEATAAAMRDARAGVGMHRVGSTAELMSALDDDDAEARPTSRNPWSR